MADKVVSLKVVVDTATGTANVENLNEELKGTVEATEQTGKQSKKVTTDMSNGFKMVGDAIGKANPMLGGLISGINMATKASLSFIATPLGIVLAAIAAAGLLLFQAFKTFQPLLDTCILKEQQYS
jgi:predicted signal transduction protein with EAL and GGDEF domain